MLPKDCEIGIQWLEFKCYAWNAEILLLRHKLVFVEESNLNIIALQRLDHNPCIYNQLLFNTEVSCENTNCSHFKLELMVWYSCACSFILFHCGLLITLSNILDNHEVKLEYTLSYQKVRECTRSSLKVNAESAKPCELSRGWTGGQREGLY